MITALLLLKRHFRTVLLPLAIALLATPIGAQQLDEVVTTAFVEAQSPGNGTLCWTLGELMVEFYANGEALDQGFLQTDCVVTGVTDPVGESGAMSAINVFPNPVMTWLTIQAAAFGTYSAEVFDVHGQRLIRQSFSSENTALDLSALPAGAYLLRVADEEKNTTTFIIQKIK